MIKINDNEFKHWLDRYKYADRFPEKTLEDYQAQCGEFLDSYNSILKNNYIYLENHINLQTLLYFHL